MSGHDTKVYSTQCSRGNCMLTNLISSKLNFEIENSGEKRYTDNSDFLNFCFSN